MTTFAPDEKTAEMGSAKRPLPEHHPERAKSFDSGQPSLCPFELNPDEFMRNDCRYRDDSGCLSSSRNTNADE
jgi:hypothetical protein